MGFKGGKEEIIGTSSIVSDSNAPLIYQIWDGSLMKERIPESAYKLFDKILRSEEIFPKTNKPSIPIESDSARAP